MKRILVSITLLYFLTSGNLFAQDVLTLEQAIDIIMRNNYDVVISRNTAAIADNDYTMGNAGMLPQVGLNASGNGSSTSFRQEYDPSTNRAPVSQSDVFGTSINAGLAFSWTLFDGGKMFVTYNKLGQIKQAGELGIKLQMEATIASVINNYYQLVSLKQQILNLQAAIKINDERIKIAETRLNVGNGNKVDLLQAKIDRNTQYSALITQEQSMISTKSNMNLLLARDTNLEFDVIDSIKLDYNKQYSELEASVINQNRTLKLQSYNLSIASAVVKETRSLYSPRFGLTANYNLSQNTSQAGITTLTRNLGPNLGFTASWNIYNGLNTRRLVQNAKLSLNSQKMIYERTRLETQTNLRRSYTAYQNAIRVVKYADETFEWAKENAVIALERFRLGNSTALEILTAQKAFEDAGAGLVMARYQAKVAETDLLKLNGELVK